MGNLLDSTYSRNQYKTKERYKKVDEWMGVPPPPLSSSSEKDTCGYQEYSATCNNTPNNCKHYTELRKKEIWGFWLEVSSETHKLGKNKGRAGQSSVKGTEVFEY